jgi:phage shock protein A
MSGEIQEWLASLNASDPDQAMVVGQAVIALADAGPALGPPVVVALDSEPPATDPAEALDYYYQDRLERLQTVRRAVADVSDLSAEVQAHITELEASQAATDAAELRRLLPGLDRAEQRLTMASQQMQAYVDAFRIRKETLKAKHTAAEAEKAIAEYLADAAAAYDDEELGPDSLTIAEAAERVKDVAAEVERELAREATPHELMELRPGTPGSPGGDIRIIFRRGARRPA